MALEVAMENLDSVASLLARRSEVTYVAITAGHYNIVVTALFENPQSLGHFMKGPLGNMAGIHTCEVLVNIDIKKAGSFSGFSDLADRKVTENTKGNSKA